MHLRSASAMDVADGGQPSEERARQPSAAVPHNASA